MLWATSLNFFRLPLDPHSLLFLRSTWSEGKL